METTPATPATEPANLLLALLAEMKGDAKAIAELAIELLKKRAKDAKVEANAKSLGTAIDNYLALDRALKAIKPTPLGFDTDGKPVSPVFSKEQDVQKKQLTEQRNKADKIINAALATGDFSQLGNVKAPAGKGQAEPQADVSAE